MENLDNKLTIEELCEIDLLFKLKYRKKSIVDFDNLIIVGKSKETLMELKNSSIALTKAENELDLGELKDKFKNKLQKQLRLSVDKAKKQD